MAMFENFPYTDMHNLNLDWIIKIAKDFLDQYTHIQQLISDGETSLEDLTQEGLEQLQTKADNLENLLQEWYTTHSNDIAQELAAALQDINNSVVTAIGQFNTAADAKTAECIASIPDDYTALFNRVVNIETKILNSLLYYSTGSYEKEITIEGSFIGEVVADDIYLFENDVIEIYCENVTSGVITDSVTSHVYIGGSLIGDIFVLPRNQFFTVSSDTTQVSLYIPVGAVGNPGTFKFHINCLNRKPMNHYDDIVGEYPGKRFSKPEATLNFDVQGNTFTYNRNRMVVETTIVHAASNLVVVAVPISNGIPVTLGMNVKNTAINSIVIYAAYSKNSWASSAVEIFDGSLETGIHFFELTAEQTNGKRFILIRINSTGTFNIDYYISYQNAEKRFYTPGVLYAYQADKAISAKEAEKLADTSYRDIVFWGDSITEGAGAGQDPSFVQKCCALLGTDSYTNAGVGGETSWTIAARQGGMIVYLPAGAVENTHYSFVDEKGNPVRPLVGGYLVGNGPPRTRSIKIKDQSGLLDRVDTDDYIITGISTTLDCKTPLIFPGSELNFKIAVIFVGTNDWDDSEPLESIPYVEAMVNKLDSNNYIVMSCYRANNSEYETAMLNAFGSHYFNTRKMLVENGLELNNLSPTAADTAAIAQGMVPPSLLDGNSIHPNGYGHNAIGIMLYNHMVFLGYDKLL